jgi:ribosomal protein S1
MNTSNTNLISIVGGSVISCTVAAIAKHPDSGVIVTIEGNPNGFIPTSLLIGERRSDKEARRAFLIENAGSFPIEGFVKEAHMLPDDSPDSGLQPAKTRAPRARIVLDEEAVLFIRKLEEDQLNLAALEVGTMMKACVMQVCTKKNSEGEGRHFIGFSVELENLYMGFLHKSEVVGEVKEGDYIDVCVLSAEMNGDRPRISVSQKAAQAKLALGNDVKVGSKTTGRNLRSATVEGIDGFTMEIGKGKGVKAFLPLTAVEGDPAALLKGSRTAKVTVLPLTLGQYVQVTRRANVANLVAAVEAKLQQDKRA